MCSKPKVRKFQSPNRLSELEISEFEISEFDSPTKDETNDKSFTECQDRWTVNTVTASKMRRRQMRTQYKAIIEDYDLSVRNFSTDFKNNKFDENQSMTLVVRHICGREDKLVWAICRHFENEMDRCVMFKPKYSYEVMVGVVVKIYQPWKEITLPGFPLPVIYCTDFYRTGKTRGDLMGVPKKFVKDLMALPIPFKYSYTKVAGEGVGALPNALHDLIPYRFINENTIKIQSNLVKPSMDLDVVVHEMKPDKCQFTCMRFEDQIFLLRDTDNCYCLLQLSHTKDTKKDEIMQVLKSGKYLKIRKIGIIDRTSVLEEPTAFAIFRELGSRQASFYTCGLRYDTEWEVESFLEFPHKPLEDCTLPGEENVDLDDDYNNEDEVLE